jgi:hypothetical protein
MTRRLFCAFVFLLIPIACFAQTELTGRDVDLTSSDGTKLKGTFFAAAKPGPGVLLLHQCNIGIGRRSPAVPATSPCVRVRTRRFGELS